MFATNNESSVVEDAFIASQLAKGMRDNAEAKRAGDVSEVLKECTQRILRQNEVIVRLQQQVAALTARAERAESDYVKLIEKNNDSVAISNAAALALKDAVKKISDVSEQPTEQVESDFRRIRTHHYDNQVANLLAKGLLSKDPRKTDAFLQRKWYVQDADLEAESLR